MKKIIFIILLLSTSSFAQYTSPFQIGNRWDFFIGEWNGQGEGSRDSMTLEILSDTLMANGKSYYRITPAYYMFKDFVRADSVGIYYYDTVNQKEWLFYKYNLEATGYENYPNGDFVRVAYERDTSDTEWMTRIYKWYDYKTFLFGDSINIFKYYCDTGLDDSYFIMINPELGFIGTEESSMFGHYDTDLIACRINGITYGELINTNENDSLKDYLDYYPLQVGNYWQYLEIVSDWLTNHSEYFSLEITKDTVLSNGKKYYKFVEKSLSKNIITNIYYERIDSATTVVYRNNNGDDFVIDSLAVNVDSSYYGSRLYTFNDPGIRTICIGEEQEIILGESFTIKEFDTQGIISQYYKLAKGLGYSSHWGAELSMWSRSLVYADVNGKVLGDKVTSVKNEDENLPQDFVLYQNYPNPFNPATKISFYIPFDGRQQVVSLHVYDVLGRKIKTLINKENISGYHEIEFYASDIPSGVYFYKIASDNFTAVKKMLLLK